MTRFHDIVLSIEGTLGTEIRPNAFISTTDHGPWVRGLAHLAANELLDRKLIGLPDGIRTSVDAKMVADLGALLGCRKGDDADDVLKTAIAEAKAIAPENSPYFTPGVGIGYHD